MTSRPTLSTVIYFANGAPTLESCLDAFAHFIDSSTLKTSRRYYGYSDVDTEHWRQHGDWPSGNEILHVSIIGSAVLSPFSWPLVWYRWRPLGPVGFLVRAWTKIHKLFPTLSSLRLTTLQMS